MVRLRKLATSSIVGADLAWLLDEYDRLTGPMGALYAGQTLGDEIARLHSALAYAVNTEGGIKPDDYDYIRDIARGPSS